MSVPPAPHRDSRAADVTMVIQRLRPYFSGQGVQVEALCSTLAGRGLQATILTAVHGKQDPWEQIDGFRIRRLRCDVPLLGRWIDKYRFRSPMFGLRVFGWLLRHGRGTQLLHVHALTDALYTGWLYARWRRIPLIFEMTLLGTDDPGAFATSTNRLRGLRNALFRRCDGYVAISPALQQAYAAAGLPPDKLRVIPQGVELQRFAPAPDRAAIRARLDLPEAGPVVVFVGSLIARKGIDVLLQAWQSVHEAVPGSTLALVGKHEFEDDPGAEAFLGGWLAALPEDARRRVRRFGVRDNVEEFLQAADVFAFPSRREGFGTVMIEAMAAGLPCVVAELPGITEFIFGADEPVGIVVPQAEPQRLAAAVIGLLRDPAGAAGIGAAARRRVEARFSSERVADAYLEFYEELLTRCGAA